MRVFIEHLGDNIEIPIGETLVGRDIGCALRFNDPSVSRRHLRFVRRLDEVFVEDLASSNGTLVNGRVITSSLRVADGDTIKVGSRTLKVNVSEGTDDDAVLDSTMLLKQASATEAQATNARRATTSMIAVTVPALTANQRCPQCGAAVSDEDETCECGYDWGTFRPQIPTNVAAVPLNRRRYDRYSIELNLVYVSSELEIEATTRDLSYSGVFVCSQVLEPVGTTCQLTMLVDGGPPLTIKGIVRRVVHHTEGTSEAVGLGVEFKEVTPMQRVWIAALLSRMEYGDETTPEPRA